MNNTPKIKPFNKFLKFIFLISPATSGINLVNTIYFRQKTYDYVMDYINKNNKIPVLLNHEYIHTPQWKELYIIGFLLLYIFEYIFKFFRYGTDAYYNISLEREAYQNDNNLEYLKTRKKYAFAKYILHK